MSLASTGPMEGLSVALAILSAMITPAVLILASSSLVLATSNRLGRVLGRARALAEQYEALVSGGAKAVFPDEKRALILDQLDKTTTRARLLQRAMNGLYMALGALVATSITLGVDAAIGQAHTPILVLLGMVGVALLLCASVLLIMESRVALLAVDNEMAYVKRLARRVEPSGATATGPRAGR